jgi:tetrahydromethanopterin S-methyltransferase subunit A
MPERMDFDPAGFFVIFIDRAKREIVVEHYLNVEKKGAKVATGRLNAVMRGKSAEKLSNAIVKAGMLSRLDHAAYVGRELHKAELALKKGAKYEQDGPLRL